MQPEMTTPNTTKAEQTQHTPGPWRLRRGPHDVLRDGWLINWGDGNMEIADLPLNFDALGRPSGEAEANAHLITAAPELLEACKYAVEYVLSPPFIALHGSVPVKKLRAAIAKAEGRSL